MIYTLALISIELKDILMAGTILGLVAGGIGRWWFSWQTSKAAYDGEEVKNWRGLVDSLKETNANLQATKVAQGEAIIGLQKKVADLTCQVNDCLETRNEVTQALLRATARETKYQTLIQELQRDAGKPVYDFSEPIPRGL